MLTGTLYPQRRSTLDYRLSAPGGRLTTRTAGTRIPTKPIAANTRPAAAWQHGFVKLAHLFCILDRKDIALPDGCRYTIPVLRPSQQRFHPGCGRDLPGELSHVAALTGRLLPQHSCCNQVCCHCPPEMPVASARSIGVACGGLGRNACACGRKAGFACFCGRVRGSRVR